VGRRRATARERKRSRPGLSGNVPRRDFLRQRVLRPDRQRDGLPRVALKMATGTGKTVVMAMIIAWRLSIRS